MMAAALERYLHKIREVTSKPGEYAFRGQPNAEWPLHSAATRRLLVHLGDHSLNNPRFTKVYADYHRESLVEPARTRGFGVESGRNTTDLELLSKLQHFGAATGLLDFTWNALVGLWFASRELDSDGKLFILNANDPINVAKVPSAPQNQTIDAVFSRAENAPGLLYWEPMLSGEATPRILRQRGVFIIGRPLIPSVGQILTEVMVLKNDKAELLKELAMLDISELSLFPDIYGFSASQRVTTSVQVRNPDFYFIQANKHYQSGDYSQAIGAYDSCIGLSPTVGELYLLRGNAKSEVRQYREAVDDYRLAVKHSGQPLLGLEPLANSIMTNEMLFMAHFNCGNALAEIAEYEAALSSYTEAIQFVRSQKQFKHTAFFNRGNVHLDLGQFDAAICDYDAAMSLQLSGTTSSGIPFNKGNALVALGRFKEALEYYRQGEQENDVANRPTPNKQLLEKIIGTIGSREYQSRFERDPDLPIDRLVVQVSGVDFEGMLGVIKGRVGNTGNFGWNGRGGKGFGGKIGFVVEVVAEGYDHTPISARNGN